MNPVREESNRLHSSNHIIPAYFRNPADAEQAIKNLSSAGFPKENIGVALREDGAGKSATSGWADRLRSLFSPKERDEYDSDNAIDVLDHIGIPEDEGRYFKNALQSGGALLTVDAGSRSNEALSILRNSKATLSSQELRTLSPVSQTANTGTQHVELLGETLRVHKDRVQRGTVKLRKEVVSEHQNVEVPVTREELVIERHPADGRASARTGFEDGKQIEVPLSEDQVRVEKRPIVREEVEVGKRQVQDTKRVGDDVKHEELRVEKEGDVKVDSSPKRKIA